MTDCLIVSLFFAERSEKERKITRHEKRKTRVKEAKRCCEYNVVRQVEDIDGPRISPVCARAIGLTASRLSAVFRCGCGYRTCSQDRVCPTGIRGIKGQQLTSLPLRHQLEGPTMSQTLQQRNYTYWGNIETISTAAWRFRDIGGGLEWYIRNWRPVHWASFHQKCVNEYSARAVISSVSVCVRWVGVVVTSHLATFGGWQNCSRGANE